MDVNLLKRTNNNITKTSKENTKKYLLPQENSPYLTKQINRIIAASNKISSKPISSKSTSVPDKFNEPHVNKSSVNEINPNSQVKQKEEKRVKDSKNLSRDYERIVSDYLDARKKEKKQETNSYNYNDRNLPMSVRNSSNNAASVSRNPIVKEFVKGNSNRTNYNQRINASMYYSKHNMSIKKDINQDKDNVLYPTTQYINTTSGNHPVASYSTSKKTLKSKNFTNFSYSNAITSRITTNVSSSTSVPKADAPPTNFLNYKILSQNSNNKLRLEANSVISSNSFNIPTNYPSNNNSNFVSQPNRKKIQNFLVISHLNSSIRNESLSNTNNESNNNYNIFNYMKEGFKSKQHTPDLSRRMIELEGSVCENSKEKQFIDSNYNFATTHDKNEENILRIFHEQNTSGRSINTTILRQIIKENPDIFDNKKSKLTTSDDTMKNTNYSTKNIESDSIEYMHFLFVNFFQKSKQILHTQENSFIMNEKSNSLMTVTPCEEVEIE